MKTNGQKAASEVCVIYCAITRKFWSKEKEAFVPEVAEASRFTPAGAGLLAAFFSEEAAGGRYEVRYMGSQPA